MSLSDQIRARLDDPTDVALNGEPYVQAIRKALEVCDKGEWQATRWAQPFPVPEWVKDMRAAIASGLGIEGGEQGE